MSAGGTEFAEAFTAAKYPALIIMDMGFGDVRVRVNVEDMGGSPACLLLSVNVTVMV